MHVEMISSIIRFWCSCWGIPYFLLPKPFFAWNERNAVHGIHHSAELKRYHARHSGSAHPRLFGASVANSTYFCWLIWHTKFNNFMKNCNFIGSHFEIRQYQNLDLLITQKFIKLEILDTKIHDILNFQHFSLLQFGFM